jgi:hypothetical protein
MMTLQHQGRTFVLEVRGPLGTTWRQVGRDADAAAKTDLIAKLLTNEDAVRRMARGEVVTMQLPEAIAMEFRFSIPDGVNPCEGGPQG